MRLGIMRPRSVTKRLSKERFLYVTSKEPSGASLTDSGQPRWRLKNMFFTPRTTGTAPPSCEALSDFAVIASPVCLWFLLGVACTLFLSQHMGLFRRQFFDFDGKVSND